MPDDDPIAALPKKIEMLCARCDALAREVRRLRDENQALRDRNDKAREKVQTILESLPETTAGGIN